MSVLRAAGFALAWIAATGSCRAQGFSQRGFLEMRSTLFPQTVPHDSGHAVGEGLLRWEGSWQARPDLKVFGAFDARADTHQQVERRMRFDWQDRSRQRPAFSLRRASLQWHRAGVTVEAGKQFIRWGKTDILNPTDRFAPRDYLNVIDNDFLGVTAGRFTYEAGTETLDVVVTPRFTPSRMPLFNQRWVPVPLPDFGSRIPGRAQFGARWNHLSQSYEASLVFYEGFHHLPLFDTRLQRFHPRLRLYGGDAAAPLRWFTLKGEAAWFTSSSELADEYILYVVQLERTSGEWVFVGGYAGEVVTEKRNPLAFAPDRGFARAFLGRASYTIDARRSAAFETALRQNGKGAWLKTEYSQQFGAHWRATASFTLIRGDMADFLGAFRSNSHALLVFRYSF